jgi:hypothetical protein
MFIAITMFIAIAITPNLHIDASLSYFKTLRAGRGGPQKLRRRRENSRGGGYCKCDHLHEGSFPEKIRAF